MTKNEVRAIVAAAAKDYGFTVRDNNFALCGWDIVDNIEDGHLVNFTVMERYDEFDTEHRQATVNLDIRASIARMGGNPSGNDLIGAGQIIARAGELVNALARMNLSYVQTW